jgi:hypothetical protein
MLFFLFIIALEYNKTDYLNLAEIAFMIYALGFTLEKVAAMQEHGIKGVFFLYHFSCLFSTLFINV